MFRCTQCGCCCRMVGLLKDFPYKSKADGSCEMLQDNKCLVYETRPSICRVDEQIKLSGMGKRKGYYRDWETDRKSTRLNSSHSGESRMPSAA